MKKINSVIWSEYTTPTDFEEKWTDVINTFNLGGNLWFKEMYKIRSSWIPSYFRDTDMGALLRTTSRSESVNSFFGKFLHSRMTLVEFYVGFNSAIDRQRINRLRYDHEARSSTPSLRSHLPIERHASEIFSIQVFTDFQNELIDSAFGCAIQIPIQCSGDDEYFVKDGKRNHISFTVTASPSSGHMGCSCMRYYSTGLVCRHLIKVMTYLQYEKIPVCLVRNRWRKEASSMQISEFAGFEDELRGRSKEDYFVAGEIMHEVRSIISDPAHKLSTLNSFLLYIRDFKEAGVEVTEKGGPDTTSKDDLFASAFGMDKPSTYSINVPNQSRNKGRGKRIKSGREIAKDASKRREIKCTNCKQHVHHNRRTCPHPSMRDTVDLDNMNGSGVCNQSSKMDES